MTDKPLDISRLGDLCEAFSQSDLSFQVDIVDWANTSESFRKIVEEEYVVVQRNTSCKTILGKFAPFVYGKSLPKKSRQGSGNVPVFGSNGIVGFHNSALTDGPAVIIGRKGTIGKIHYSSVPCWPIDTTFFVTDPDIEILRFKYYMLKSLNLQHMNSDSAVPGLNRNEAHAYKIQLPSLPVQKAVASILGTLDNKIELNRQMSETLEEMAQALFKSWFVDFDPVRAKMEDRDTDLPKHIADLFPDRLVGSELGEIPEGWEVRPIDKIATFQNGLALQKHRPQGEENRLPVVKIAQLRSGSADSGEWATSEIRPDCIINDGDVIFSWSGSLMVKLWCGGRAALNQHLFKVTSKAFPKWFYLNCIYLHLAEFRTIAAGKATTMGHIKRSHLSDALCVVPNHELLVAVDKFFSPLIEKSISSNLQSRTLSDMRDTLLPKLISGEIRLANAKKLTVEIT